MTALLKMTATQATIWNRTQMHSGIRGATEVLQQEVGQAGRVALPVPVTLTSASTAGATVTLAVTSTTGMFVGERLVLDTGANAGKAGHCHRDQLDHECHGQTTSANRITRQTSPHTRRGRCRVSGSFERILVRDCVTRLGRPTARAAPC